MSELGPNAGWFRGATGGWRPFGLIACLVGVFFWRFFFLGYVPVPGDLVSQQYSIDVTGEPI